MPNRLFIVAAVVLVFLGCTPSRKENLPALSSLLQGRDYLPGKKEYLASPFVAAGDRLYMVGHQDGGFPPLGWHLAGEMGGVWDHPIKLLDGFDAAISSDGKTFCLNKATRFINYPFGNRQDFSWPAEGLEIQRFQFVPDGEEGLVIEFKIINKSTASKTLSFAFTGYFDLRPTWLGDRTGMINHEDEVRYFEKEQVLVAKDKGNPWFAVMGSDHVAKGSSLEFAGCGDAGKESKPGTIRYEVKIDGDGTESLKIVIAGSYQSEAQALTTFSKVKHESYDMLSRKILRYDSLKALSEIKVPDTVIQRMLEWTKYTTDWLVREVPEQGRGLSAGIPDYPWWFGCDNEYSLQAVLATGRFDLAKSTIRLLKKISDKTNGNGRIIHEASTNGSVYNPGNTNETAQFISLLWNYYQWTGDKQFVTELYPDVLKGIHWLLVEKDPDQNLFPNGGGMTEIQGLDSEMIDVSVYTQQALEAAAKLSEVMGEDVNQKDFWDKAARLKVLINQQWWVAEDNSFADFIGTREEAIALIKAAIIRADTLKKVSAGAELRARLKRLESSAGGHRDKSPRGYVVFHNAVVNSPMEVGIANAENARRALQTARQYRNFFGAYVTGIDRSDEVDSVVAKARKKTFNYTGAVMTLPTGVLAIAEARYGNSNEALEYLKRLGHTFSYALPGSMYEVSPDFGMMAQAWNIYAVETPVISHFFGITPDAGGQTITVKPNMPQAWDKGSIANLKVGGNRLDLSIAKRKDSVTYTLSQTIPDWKLKVYVNNSAPVLVNNKPLQPDSSMEGSYVVLTGEKKYVVKLSSDVRPAVIP